MDSHNCLTICLEDICENLKLIGKGKRVMAMVKANAYGTDSVVLSKFLEAYGIDILGVATPHEGAALRTAGIKTSIFVISALPSEAKKIVDNDLEVSVCSQELIQSLEQAALYAKKKVKVHLNIDTGMGRMGCKVNQARLLAQEIAKNTSLVFEGIMTHFACADMKEEDSFTLQQIERFSTALQDIGGLKPRWVHAANSSAAIRGFFNEGNMVRIGIGMFMGPKLAVHLTSRIVSIRTYMKDDTISYARTYTVQEDNTRIAAIPLGYFDGLHRHYSNKGYVIIRGKKAPLVGNICMDLMMCNITHIPDVVLEDPVLIFGEDEAGNTFLPEEFAKTGSTISYELLSCLGPRIHRKFIPLR